MNPTTEKAFDYWMEQTENAPIKHLLHYGYWSFIAWRNMMVIHELMDEVKKAGGTYHCSCGIRMA